MLTALPALLITALASPATAATPSSTPSDTEPAAKADAAMQNGMKLLERAMNPAHTYPEQEQEILSGIRYLEQAAEAGHTKAMLTLSQVCCRFDRTKALDWAQKAAKAGEPRGYIMIARLTADREQAKTFMRQAVEQAEHRADAAHSDDWLLLHNIYDQGAPEAGIPKNRVKAAQYLKQAAEAGNEQARICHGLSSNHQPTADERARHTAYLRQHPSITGKDGLTEQTFLDFHTEAGQWETAFDDYIRAIYPGAKKTGPAHMAFQGKGAPAIRCQPILLPDGRLLQIHTAKQLPKK